MIWGLFTSIFSGLGVDLKLYRKEIANDVQRDYTGYDGKISFVRPEFVDSVTEVFTKVNQQLSQSNSAIMTLLLMMLGSCIALVIIYLFLKNTRRKQKNVSDDLENNLNQVTHLGDQVETITRDKKRSEMMEMTRKMIKSLGPAPGGAVRVLPAIPAIPHDPEDGEIGGIQAERNFGDP